MSHANCHGRRKPGGHLQAGAGQMRGLPRSRRKTALAAGSGRVFRGRGSSGTENHKANGAPGTQAPSSRAVIINFCLRKRYTGQPNLSGVQPTSHTQPLGCRIRSYLAACPSHLPKNWPCVQLWALGALPKLREYQGVLLLPRPMDRCRGTAIGGSYGVACPIAVLVAPAPGATSNFFRCPTPARDHEESSRTPRDSV